MSRYKSLSEICVVLAIIVVLPSLTTALTIFDGSFSLLALRCHSFSLSNAITLSYNIKTLNGGTISVYVATADCYDGIRVSCYDPSLSSLFVTTASLGLYGGPSSLKASNWSLIVCSNSIDRQITISGYIKIDTSGWNTARLVFVLLLFTIAVILSSALIYLFIKDRREMNDDELVLSLQLVETNDDGRPADYGTIGDKV